MPDLREEFNTLKKEATDVIELAKKESRDLSAEEREANDKRFARIDVIQKIVSDEHRLAHASIEQFSTEVKSAIKREAGDAKTSAKTEGRQEMAHQAHVKAVEDYIRYGALPQAREEFIITTATGGGVLLPKSVTKPVVIKRQFNMVLAALQAYGYTPIYTSDTATISVPVFDDTANVGSQIAEDLTTENPIDPATAALTLGAKLYDSGAVWFSNTQLAALSYDLLGYVQPVLDKRIDVKMNSDWFTKMVNNASVGKTGATTTGVTYVELVSLYHSLPIPYRADAVFFVSDGFIQGIENMQDTLGRPIYRQSIADDAPDTLLGKPVFVTDGLTAPASGAVSAVIASAECLKVRIVTDKRLTRYANLPNKRDQVGLEEFVNSDFDFVPSGVRAFKQSGS